MLKKVVNSTKLVEVEPVITSNREKATKKLPSKSLACKKAETTLRKKAAQATFKMYAGF
jgi:hypothetical protein